MNVLRKQAGRFRRLTAIHILSCLRKQQFLHAIVLRLWPSMLLLGASIALLATCVTAPLWAGAGFAAAWYLAFSGKAFVALQRKKSTARHLVRSCLMHTA